MKILLPDPHAQARAEAETINAKREMVLNLRINRILADCPQLDRDRLLEGLTAFHRRRMGMIPSTARYPEAAPWVQHTLIVEREVQQLTGFTDDEMAILRSLDLYITFHGMRRSAACDEKCRIAFVPDTDRGPISISNTDDPLDYWKPSPPPTAFPYPGGLAAPGVGNGLHLDEEPDELFPLPVTHMMPHYTRDVPGGVEFLTRYCPFWGRCNLILFDDTLRSVAIEKCSFKYIDVFHPGPDGRSHISGMTCRDNNTTQGRHQQAMRESYLKLFNLPQDGPDMCFWNACRKFETKLARELTQLGTNAHYDDLLRLFLAPWPKGLNKWGLRVHPDAGLVGYTLQTHVLLLREKTYLRWQRSEDGTRYPAEPETYQANR
ncbi:MAG: hypothetical protein A2269_07690 [Lentisphaerae bacterium RIFOXYA12_FULL_60_10]|nr:MAG: hypothetical protein A2269_07690 [Lentisphaerae bacterium RIFOXYA12_FULL_60_10]